MAADLDIHPASRDEVIAAHHNVFDIWSKGRSLADHVRHRLQSPTHRRAEWFVGCVDRRVVTSLAGHPVRFKIGADEFSGIAIGSVYTLRDVRGHGFAPRLIRWVEDFKREQGTGLSVLYSDIKPDYYAQLGYQLCPAWQGWCDVQAAAARRPATHRLAAFSADDHLPLVKRLYAGYHGARPLSIARNDEYWSMMLEKFAACQFYSLIAAQGNWQGYALLDATTAKWRIIDYALADHSPALLAELYAAVIAAAQAAGAERAGGWLPDVAAARELFEVTPRKDEITMIKPLAWHGTLTPEMIAGTTYFCELDHV
ncbi:MAG: GNAT family N-acetyltransferase [Pirellulales bacterium]